MAGVPVVTIEVRTGIGSPEAVLYYATRNYNTKAADTPASTLFEGRIMADLDFTRSVGTLFWGGRPRGEQNFGVIQLANADGMLDAYAGRALRDNLITIKRGEDGDAYSTFSTVAIVMIDRLDVPDEERVGLYVKDLGAKLERALQQTLYPSTITNQAIRGKPRPITVGRCYQVPLQQPDSFGNGNFDVHDDDNWVGVEQLLDQGVGMVEGTAYKRSLKSFGFERLNAIGGKQVATVLGAFTVTTTEITEDFANLTNWTETNGGVAGRDASIVSNELRMENTAGGADLMLDWAGASIAATDADFFFYEFNCTQFTSGTLDFRSGLTTIERTVDKVGRYTGIVRAASAWIPRFWARDGRNCDLRIDALRIKKVSAIEALSAMVTYLTVTKGPLLAGDLDSTAISALQTAAPYSFGFHVSEPIQIADALDQLLQSVGGWWYINRTGKLTVGRLTAPTGTPAYSFDSTNIAQGMRIEFDAARGLSNVLLAKRNWGQYGEADLAASINYVQLSSSDIDADVTLSGSNYDYSASNVGSVRSTPLIAGDRYYVEVDPTTVDGTQQHYIGWGNVSATIANYPGADGNAVSFRANGQTFSNGAGSAFGGVWSAANKIPMAIDGRAAAMGSRARHFRLYWAIDSTWQNSASPTAGTGFIGVNVSSTGFGYVMVGNNVAGTNAGNVNFGQVAFGLAPPDDYIPIAWHRQYVLADFRYKFQSAVSLAQSYRHAVSTPVDTSASPNLPNFSGGIPTLISAMADARTECDRWATLYSAERFFYEFDVFLDAINADQIEPGNLIAVTYPRFSLSARLLRVVSVRGKLLNRRVTIRAWG